MTDAPQAATNEQQPQAEDQAKGIEIEFSLPATVNFGMWQGYLKAKGEYAHRIGDEDIAITIQRFYGAKYLIQKGVVHVKPEGFFDEAFKTADKETERDNIDVCLARYLEYGVCIPFEAMTMLPLPGISLKKS